MPAVKPTSVPKYRHHKPTGRAVVTINGHHLYLGVHGSPESRTAYDRAVAEWLAHGRADPAAPKPASQVLVGEVIRDFWRHAVAYYVGPDGAPTSEVHTYRQALRLLRALYGDTPAAEFGPLKLKAARDQMIRGGWAWTGRDGARHRVSPWCREHANKQTSRIKSVFRWAAENERVPPSVHHGLLAVSGLKRGRCDARESDPVTPADAASVEAVLPRLSAQVAAMVRLQLLTGARPGELVIMRPCDLDVSGDVWIYSPAHHKTEHHGHGRRILIGPAAQRVLAPFLARATTAHCFSPAEAEANRLKAQHAARTTPQSCGNNVGTNRVKRPKRQPGDRYDVGSYRRAIQRACDAAGVDRFHPHQLRHTAATNIRREHGLEAAQVILGHRHARTTEIYAEANVAKAESVMRIVG